MSRLNIEYSTILLLKRRNHRVMIEYMGINREDYGAFDVFRPFAPSLMPRYT